MVSLDSLGWTFSPPIHFCDIFCKILPFGNWKCNSDSIFRLAPAHLHMRIHALTHTCIHTNPHTPAHLHMHMTHTHSHSCTHSRTHSHFFALALTLLLASPEVKLLLQRSIFSGETWIKTWNKMWIVLILDWCFVQLWRQWHWGFIYHLRCGRSGFESNSLWLFFADLTLLVSLFSHSPFSLKFLILVGYSSNIF